VVETPGQPPDGGREGRIQQKGPGILANAGAAQGVAVEMATEKIKSIVVDLGAKKKSGSSVSPMSPITGWTRLPL
jgi:hypothetical protein